MYNFSKGHGKVRESKETMYFFPDILNLKFVYNVKKNRSGKTKTHLKNISFEVLESHGKVIEIFAVGMGTNFVSTSHFFQVFLTATHLPPPPTFPFPLLMKTN